MFMKLAAAFTSVALLGAGLAIVASPAQAVSPVSISAPNVTVAPWACKNSRLTVSGDWAGDAYNSISVEVTDSYGDWAGGDSISDSRSGSVAVDVELCGYDNTSGRYTVRVSAEGYDQNYENQTLATATRIFTFKKVDTRANSAITKKAKRTGGKYKWKVPGRLVRAGRGYVNRRVAIEAVIMGEWTQLETQRTQKKGRFGWSFKPNGYSWRYVFYGNGNTKPAATKAFRTPRKGGSGRETSVDPLSLIS